MGNLFSSPDNSHLEQQLAQQRREQQLAQQRQEQQLAQQRQEQQLARQRQEQQFLRAQWQGLFQATASDEDNEAEYYLHKTEVDKPVDWRRARKAARAQTAPTPGRRKRGRKSRGDLYDDDYHAGHSKKTIQGMCQERHAHFEVQHLQAAESLKRERGPRPAAR